MILPDLAVRGGNRVQRANQPAVDVTELNSSLSHRLEKAGD